MKSLYKYFSVILLAFFVTACSSDNNSPEGVAEKFLVSFYKGDTNAMLDLLYIPEQDKKDDFKEIFNSKFAEMAKEAVKFAEKHNGLDKVECSEPNYQNEDKTSASVKTKIIFKDGHSSVENIKVIKVNNKWFINLK